MGCTLHFNTILTIKNIVNYFYYIFWVKLK